MTHFERAFPCLFLRLSFLGACGTATLGLLSYRTIKPNTSQLRINHDTAAILAYDDFLAHTDIQLALRGNLVEASTASITLHVDDTQTIVAILADTLERTQQTRLYGQLQVLGFFAKLLFLCSGFADAFFQLTLFDVEIGATIVHLHVVVSH